MARLVYFAFPRGDIQGGQKMILRHVETLRDLGFDAVCWLNKEGVAPAWLEHRAPIVVDEPIRPDDVMVIPDDAPNAIAYAAGRPQRTVIFSQNQHTLGTQGAPALEKFAQERLPAFLVVGRAISDLVSRLYPQARIETVRAFADERVFRPGEARGRDIVFVPRKRAAEAAFIRQVFPRLHPRHAAWNWSEIRNLPEPGVARVFAASELFLSLSRFESVGMTPLEAMATGCICTGFTGIGGQEYATADNGFWVPEDDCVAAVDGLAAAADLVASGGAPLTRMREAGIETAREWSYANFRVALEAAWMALAPDARIRNGPLD